MEPLHANNTTKRCLVSTCFFKTFFHRKQRARCLAMLLHKTWPLLWWSLIMDKTGLMIFFCSLSAMFSAETWTKMRCFNSLLVSEDGASFTCDNIIKPLMMETSNKNVYILILAFVSLCIVGLFDLYWSNLSTPFINILCATTTEWAFNSFWCNFCLPFHLKRGARPCKHSFASSVGSFRASLCVFFKSFF